MQASRGGDPIIRFLGPGLPAPPCVTVRSGLASLTSLCRRSSNYNSSRLVKPATDMTLVSSRGLTWWPVLPRWVEKIKSRAPTSFWDHYTTGGEGPTLGRMV